MKKKRILIADDEEGVRFLLSTALQNEYEVDAVENGVKAINQMNMKSYDLIITDYMMPWMDGLELIRRISEKYPLMPIILITAYGPMDKFVESGVATCLIKPFDVSYLKNIIKDLINGSE